MKINPHQLRALRNAKGISIADLASVSNVSTKQIQRLENPEFASKSPRETTVNRLAKGLGVKPEDLAGEATSSKTDPPWFPPSRRVSHRLESGALLAYDLVEERYSVKAEAIVNAAPLFFVLLAEASLAWRQKELDEIEEAIARVRDLGDGSNRKRFTWGVNGAEDGADYEADAIGKRDLFNDPFPDDYSFPENEEWTTNPFAEYLRKLSEDLNVPGIAVERGFAQSFVSANFGSRMPDYSVCEDELNKIAPGETFSRARIVLRNGDVRIADIPEHLRPEEAVQQRQKWLASKASEKTILWLESLRDFLLRYEMEGPETEESESSANASAAGKGEDASR